MYKRLFPIALAVTVGGGYSLTAFSQVKPQTLVKQRQAAMTLQGKYFYPLLNMVRGRIPYDANAAVRNAAYLDALSKMPWDGFAPNTKDAKSGALPAVYTDTVKFKENQDRLQSEVAKLVAVSKGGSEPAIKAQIEAVDKACGSCHETFRERQ
ncbi:MAG: cytochrome c [Betaproteobacteria bacterium]|nr:cytochrome c [Betaproteobacteria bacterium]